MTEEEFWAVLVNQPEPKPIFYRAYYNSAGQVETYSMEELPGNYIDVDQATYVVAPNARVINGQLHVIKPAITVTKLVPGATGTPCDPSDVCIVTDATKNIKWSLKASETD
jgi:hypothetical protein